MPAISDRADTELPSQHSRSCQTVLLQRILTRWHTLTCNMGNRSWVRRKPYKVMSKRENPPLHIEGSSLTRAGRRCCLAARLQLNTENSPQTTQTGRRQRWEHLLPDQLLLFFSLRVQQGAGRWGAIPHINEVGRQGYPSTPGLWSQESQCD